MCVCCCRIQPESGKVTSVSVMVPEVGGAVGDKMEEVQGPGEEREKGEREYGGGRFAGVGDFKPTILTVAMKRRDDLPSFISKPEAALRYIHTIPTACHLICCVVCV